MDTSAGLRIQQWASSKRPLARLISAGRAFEYMMDQASMPSSWSGSGRTSLTTPAYRARCGPLPRPCFEPWNEPPQRFFLAYRFSGPRLTLSPSLRGVPPSALRERCIG